MPEEMCEGCESEQGDDLGDFQECDCCHRLLCPDCFGRDLAGGDWCRECEGDDHGGADSRRERDADKISKLESTIAKREQRIVNLKDQLSRGKQARLRSERLHEVKVDKLNAELEERAAQMEEVAAVVIAPEFLGTLRRLLELRKTPLVRDAVKELERLEPQVKALQRAGAVPNREESYWLG